VRWATRREVSPSPSIITAALVFPATDWINTRAGEMALYIAWVLFCLLGTAAELTLIDAGNRIHYQPDYAKEIEPVRPA
jgi:hypothetical protein